MDPRICVLAVFEVRLLQNHSKTELKLIAIQLCKCVCVWDGSVAEWLACGLRRSRVWVPIAAATLSGNSLRQTVHTHCASVHLAAKLIAALFRVAGVTAGLAQSNGSLPPGL